MLQLRRTELSEDYNKKWNENNTDFLHIYKDGVKVSDTLYRTGMFGGKVEDKHFLMLKYTEDLYEDKITKDKNKKRHLKGEWCIINSEGKEIKVFERGLRSPYILGESVYVIDGSYHNIETDELYCKASSSISTDQFLFIENHYDDDKSKRGVLKIDKFDGTYELFSKKINQ